MDSGVAAIASEELVPAQSGQGNFQLAGGVLGHVVARKHRVVGERLVEGVHDLVEYRGYVRGDFVLVMLATVTAGELAGIAALVENGVAGGGKADGVGRNG